MATCLEVADFFIANADPDDEITNLKLQKMCAYAQAFSLVLLEQKLFDDQLEAWRHGPVVRYLYNKYEAAGSNPLDASASALDSRAPFTAEELFILETVNSYYGAYSASRLRNMSHGDFPGDFGTQGVIPVDAIRTRFSTNKVVKTIQDSY
ncbi:MAG: DUF4065 domain-containing protein [Deltaproteobacteria bacterium]|jgi:uncharacterized phage-associated protein|nr:DUF4065 domain-containing protein [Deltaproteobacteria bacterium]